MTATVKGPVTSAIQQIWSSFFQAAQDYNGRKRSHKSKPDPEVKIRRLSEAQIDRHLHPKKKLRSMKYQRIITNPEDSDDLPDFSCPDDSESEKENDQKVPSTKTPLAYSSGNVVCNAYSDKLNERKSIADNSISTTNNEPKNFLTIIQEKKQKYYCNKSGNFLNDKICENSSSKIASSKDTESDEPALKKFKVENINCKQSLKSVIKEHENASAGQDSSLSDIKPTKAMASIPNELPKLVKTTSHVDKGTMTTVNEKTAVNVGVNTDNTMQSECAHKLDGSSLLLHMKLNDVLFSKENPISKGTLTLKTDKEAQDVVTHIKSIIERLDSHKKDAADEFNAMKVKYDTKMKDIEGCLEQLYGLKIELLKGMGSWIVDPVGTLKDVQQKVTDFFEPAFQNVQLQSKNVSETENITVKHKIMEVNGSEIALPENVTSLNVLPVIPNVSSSPTVPNSVRKRVIASSLKTKNKRDIANSSNRSAEYPKLSSLLTAKSTAPSTSLNSLYVTTTTNQNLGIPTKSLEIKKTAIGRPAKDVSMHKNIPTTVMSNVAPSQPSILQNQGAISIFPVIWNTSVPQNTTSQNTAKLLEGSNLNVATAENRPAVSIVKNVSMHKAIPTTVMPNPAFSQPSVLQNRSSISISPSTRTTVISQNTTSQITAKPFEKCNNSKSGLSVNVTVGPSNTPQAPPPYPMINSQANFQNKHFPWKSHFVPGSTSARSTNLSQGQLFHNTGAMQTSNNQSSSQKLRQPHPFPQTGSIPQPVVPLNQPRISVQPLEKLQTKPAPPQYSNSASSLQTGQSIFQGVPPSQVTTWNTPPVTASSSQMVAQHAQLQQPIVNSVTTNSPRYVMQMQPVISPNVSYSPNMQGGMPTRMNTPHFTYHYPASTVISTSMKVGNFPQAINPVAGGNVQSNGSAFIHQHSLQTAVAPVTASSNNNRRYTSASSDDDVQEITTCFLCGKDSSITCCGSFVYCSQECKDEDFERHQQECSARRL